MHVEALLEKLGREARQDGALLTAPARLDGAACAALAAAGQFRNLRPGETVFARDRGIRATGLLLSGLLRFQRHGADGRRQILNLILPGEVLDPDVLDRAEIELQAATPGTLLVLPEAVFADLLAAQPALRDATVRSHHRQLDRLRWLSWAILTGRTKARVCAFLDLAAAVMPVAPRCGGGHVITITLTRSDVADLLATTPETISRALHALHLDGEIDMLAPDRIAVPRPDALRRRFDP
jgi:CRP-like cAMP-binding protein